MAFQVVHNVGTSKKLRHGHQATESNGASEPLTSDSENVEWGVSYIGGDPCGSKYNDDPFDASKEVSKPGMPDSMKARIDAMAAKKLEEQGKNEEN